MEACGLSAHFLGYNRHHTIKEGVDCLDEEKEGNMNNLLKAKTDDLIPLRGLDKPALEAYEKEASDAVKNQLANQQFRSAFGKTAQITDAEGNILEVLVGLDKAPEDPRATIQLFARLTASLPSRSFEVSKNLWPDCDLEQAAIGWGLGTYRFDRYIKKEKPKEWPKLFAEGVDVKRVRHQLAAVFLSRDLINTPAGDLGTEELCAQANQIAVRHGASLDLIMGEKLEKEYPAIHAVGKGSHRPPALIDLKWGNEKHPKLTLVGKGVVFDSGGLDVKPAAGMLLMKKDMGGSAVVLGLTQLIMDAKLPVRLRTLIPTVENAVSATAYRPGDIVSTRKGITVEIGNTDAEGRMILCDALALAVDESPDLIIDMATLTGACRIALGQDLPGFYTPSRDLARDLEDAADQVADPVWHMPLWAPYLKGMKGKISDLNNISNTSQGGSITAALFLHEFVRPYKNWLHFDIYGWRTDNIPGTPKGGEASALRAVFRLLENRYRK